MSWKSVGAAALVVATAAACDRAEPPVPNTSSAPEPKSAHAHAAPATVPSPSRPYQGVVYAADYTRSYCHAGESWKKVGEGHWEEQVDPGAEKAKASEVSAIASTKSRVRREGDRLTVRGVTLANKSFEEFVAEGAEYTYRGRFARLDADVVTGAHWEWSSWTVIDADGRKIAMSGPPVPSPDGRLYAATGDDPMGEAFNGLEIAFPRNGVYEIVQIDAAFACDPRWTAPDTLEIRYLPGRFEDHDVAVAEGRRKASDWRQGRVVRDGAGWKLVPPAP